MAAPFGGGDGGDSLYPKKGRKQRVKIVVAMDSFKGSCSSMDGAQSVKKGLLRVWPEADIHCLPIADGGEGTVEAMLSAGGRLEKRLVTGPSGKLVQAGFAVLGDTAVVEMAAAAGLTLVPLNERNPMVTTTYGVGELILEAAKTGCKRVILGIGGSATNDGGIGAASALGIAFFKDTGELVDQGGAGLEQVRRIQISGLNPLINELKIEIACDVGNLLYGPTGAAKVFSPQKGADSAMVERLDEGLNHYAEVLAQYGFEAQFQGAGAAGGLAVPLVAFCGATIRSGIDCVLDALDFDRMLKGAALVVTGEGQIDFQTAFGKAPVGVATRAKKQGIPVIALTGSLGEGYQEVYLHGIDAVFSIQNGPMTLQNSMNQAASLLEDIAERAARAMAIRL